MSKEQDLIIKIKAKVDDATKQISTLTKQVEKLTKQNDKFNTSSNNTSTNTTKVTKGFGVLTKTIGGLVGGFGALAVGMKAIEFTKMAKDAEQSANAFDVIFTDLGYNAEEEFNKIKEASKNLIPEASVRQSALTAQALGVPIEKLAELMEVARVKAKIMGTDVGKAFNDLAIGIGRGSPLILDNLGLIIKLEDANKKYAKELGKTVAELTKQEKQIALTNAVIVASADDMRRFGDSEQSANEATQELKASIADLKVQVGEALLPQMLKLTKATNEWVKSIDKDAIDKYADRVEKIVGFMIKLDDYMMPDFFTGEEDVGFIENTATALGNVVDVLTIIEDTYDALFNAQDKLVSQKDEVDSLARAVENFAGTEEELDGYKRAILEIIEKNKKLIESWRASDSVHYAESIKVAEDQLHLMLDVLEDIVKAEDPFKELAKGAEEAGEATKELTEETIKYSDKQLAKIKEANKERIADTKRTISKLGSEEKKLVAEIAKAHEDLAKELDSIAGDRFQTNLDISDELRTAYQDGLSVTQAYADQTLQIEEKLALAKDALAKGELDKYRAYIDDYKSLALSSAEHKITAEGKVARSAQETSKIQIGILNTVSSLENQYYDEKESVAKALHDATVAQKQAEMDATIALLEARKEELKLSKEIAEQWTGKTFDMDFTALDAAINKLKGTKILIDSLDQDRKEINVGSQGVDVATAKVQELKTITLNGITMEVDANTTPANFEIKKLIVDEEKNEITMDVNPEWDEAQKALDDLRSEAEAEPIETPVELDTDRSKEMMDELRAYIKKPSTHTVDPNTNEAKQAINALKVPTSSTHTVYVREVIQRAGGGAVPQKLATGGTFTGSGRVSGYDATDSDKVNAYLTGGEFVIKRRAVDTYGLAFLNAINGMKLPKPKGYAEGGLVGSSTAVTPQLTPINLNIGGNSFNVLSPADVAKALQTYIETEGGM